MGALDLICVASRGAIQSMGWGSRSFFPHHTRFSPPPHCSPPISFSSHLFLFLLLPSLPPPPISSLPQLCNQVQQLEQRLQAQAASLAADQETVERLSDWITATEETLSLRDQEPLPEDARQLEELRCQHTVR